MTTPQQRALLNQITTARIQVEALRDLVTKFTSRLGPVMTDGQAPAIVPLSNNLPNAAPAQVQMDNVFLRITELANLFRTIDEKSVI